MLDLKIAKKIYDVMSISINKDNDRLTMIADNIANQDEHKPIIFHYFKKFAQSDEEFDNMYTHIRNSIHCVKPVYILNYILTGYNEESIKEPVNFIFISRNNNEDGSNYWLGKAGLKFSTSNFNYHFKLLDPIVTKDIEALRNPNMILDSSALLADEPNCIIEIFLNHEISTNVISP